MAWGMLCVPAAAKEVGPAKSTSTMVFTKNTPPEWDVGCPVPTLEECQAAGFLAGDLDDERQCGALQAEHDDWTCMTLFLAAHDDFATSSGTIAWEVVPSIGISTNIARVPPTAEELAVVHEGDLMNQGSASYLRAFSEISNTLGAVDPVPHWRKNVDKFYSCNEYAFEQYYELNRFWHEIKRKRHNYLETYKAAFSDYRNDYAIGTRRLNGQIPARSDGYKDINGNSVLPSRQTGYRNRFFDLPELPELGDYVLFTGNATGNNPGGGAGPNLSVALGGYSDFGL